MTVYSGSTAFYANRMVISLLVYCIPLLPLFVCVLCLVLVMSCVTCLFDTLVFASYIMTVYSVCDIEDLT